MKLHEMTDEQLSQMIEQLERSVNNSFDKYKRWEAEQKLKLAKAEQQKRHPVERLKRGFKQFFNK